MRVVRSHTERGVLQKEPQESFKSLLQPQRKIVVRGIQTSTRGWHCGRFQEPAQQMEKAISQWQQQLHLNPAGNIRQLTLKWWGDRNWRQTWALHHGGQAWRKAGPGAGPKRSDRQAAGGWHPSRGRLSALRTQGFPGCSRAFSAAPGSQRWFFRAKSTVETGRGRRGRCGSVCVGVSPAFLLCAHFVSVT